MRAAPRFVPALLAGLAAALALAGCGGSGAGGGGIDAAAAVPASADALLTVDTNLGSGQWDTVRDLVKRVTGDEHLFELLAKQAGGQDTDSADIGRALGDEVTVVVLHEGAATRAVGLAQPKDRGELDRLLARSGGDTVVREVGDWTVLASDQASIAAYERALGAGKLADDAGFADAATGLPDEALLRLYVAGHAFSELADTAGAEGAQGVEELRGVRWLRIAVQAVDEGLSLDGAVRAASLPKAPTYRPALLGRVPGDALVAASWHGSADILDRIRQGGGGDALDALRTELGVEPQALAALFRGEGAAYLRAGASSPEATVLVAVDDEAAAMATLDTLADRAAREGGVTRGTETAGGLEVHTLADPGTTRLAWAARDGVLAATTARDVAAAFATPAAPLSGSDAFRRDADASKLGEETQGLLWADLGGLLRLALDESDAQLPPQIAPTIVSHLLVHAGAEGDTATFHGLLSVG